MRRTSQLRAKNLLVIHVMLATLLVLAMVPLSARAEEGEVGTPSATEAAEQLTSEDVTPADEVSAGVAPTDEAQPAEALASEIPATEAPASQDTAAEPDEPASQKPEPEAPSVPEALAEPSDADAPTADLPSADDPVPNEPATDDSSTASAPTNLSDDLQLIAQDDGSAAVTVKNLRLYDLDGTEQTLSGDYDCQKRFVIVGRPGCLNTQNTVQQAYLASLEDEFSDIAFLVLDIDGNRDVFNEGFASMETDRLRFFSSDNSAYSKWVWWAYWALGNEAGSVTLPLTVLIDKSNHVQAVLTGVQDVEALCRTYLSSNESNPDDVDPGDPDQFEPEVPDDPTVYDALSFSVWGKADMRSGRELLPLVNQARAAVGAPALTWDAELEQTALQRGAEQMVLYSHTRPNGSTCFTAWPASQRRFAAENIAWGQTSAVQVNSDWTSSSGHYANMIDPDLTSFAAAHFVSKSGQDYWVECFGGGTGSGMTDSPVMGEVLTPIEAIKGNVDLVLLATRGVYVSSMGTLGRSIPTLKIGQDVQLSLAAGDADVDASDTIWTSSNPSVLTVDESGRIAGVSEGTADVTATLASYPDLTVTETVTVEAGEYSKAGTWGTCPWEIDDNGTLWVYPGMGEGTEAYYTSPVSYWIDYAADIKAVRFVAQSGRKVVAPENCLFLFGQLTNLVSADLTGLDTSQVTNLHGLFAGCSKLREVKLSGLDAPSLVDTARMFLDCTSLESLDLSGLDVSHVTVMYYMFEGCTALKELNVSGWDTSQVDDMDGMFRYCSSLTSLDLSDWDISSLNWDNFTYPMFEGCASLSRLCVGEKYVVSDERGWPDATASNGLWWSTASQQWLSKADIVAGGQLGRLDIFAAYEVDKAELPVSIRDAQVTVESCVYTGWAQEPAVVVTYDGVTLTEGDDYVLSYDASRNVNAGQGRVTVTGAGRFVGSRRCSFTIAPASLASATVEGLAGQTFVYTGAAIKPSVTVKLGNKTLVKGTDYTVAYTNNVNAGQAQVKVTGKGNYAGTAAVTFDIQRAALSDATVSAIATQKYSGKALQPAVTVTVAGKTLVAGTDYTVAYENNVQVGTATVTLTGVGNYEGETFSTFAIKAAQAISASGKSVAMGKTVKLGAKLTSGNGKLTYKSSNTKVAKVSATGVITPVGVGTCKITITAAETSGFAKATKSVTVKVVKGVQVISASNKTVKTGKTVSIGAKRTPGNGKLTYKSSNTNVATVNSKGVITAKNVGTAKITITAAATTNWKKATKTITVKVAARPGAWKGSGSQWRYLWTGGGYPKNQFLTISGKTYWFNGSGYCVYGWKKIGSSYYYFESSGAMAKNKWVGNYWLGANGVMATNAWVDGGKYWVGSDGVWVQGKTK